MIRIAAILILMSGSALAESVLANRTIRAHEVIGPHDVVLHGTAIQGVAQQLSDVVGQEARVALYAGRPVRLADIGPPSVVERNEIIRLIYERHGLRIATEGRALDRAGPGDMIRVMNLSSRNTVTALIDESGAAHVSW